MSDSFSVLAKPNMWSFWYAVNPSANGAFTADVSADPDIDESGSFTGEISYYGENGWTTEEFYDDGVEIYVPEEGSDRQIKMRFRAYTADFLNIDVTVDYSENSSARSFGPGYAQISWPSFS